MKYRHSIIIGDWSNDGHGRNDTVIFNSTHNKEDIRAAYLKACKISQISLHYNDDKNCTTVLYEYEDDRLLHETYLTLEKLGVNFKRIIQDSFADLWDEEENDWDIIYNPTAVALLFLEMVKTQIENFNYELITEIPLNGFWQEGFNFGFGYGVYYE